MSNGNLRRAVLERSRVEGDLILVDDFLNHRVDPQVMGSVGRELAEALAPFSPTMLLTAEASGIPPAVAGALELGAPMVYAKKYLGTGNRYAYGREVTSPTKGVEYRVEVSRRILGPGERVAIVDDILAQGRTAEALGEIVEEAGSEVVGLAFAVEKCFMSGRARLEAHRWRVMALVEVESLAGGVVTLRETAVT
jgi:xanthine phosphoribosyltransferase